MECRKRDNLMRECAAHVNSYAMPSSRCLLMWCLLPGLSVPCSLSSAVYGVVLACMAGAWE